MWETKASELFTKGINDLVMNGWTAKRITALTYELTDAAGVTVLGRCYVEQFPRQERYSIFIALNSDLTPVGTVALDADGLFKSYDIEGNIYTAKKKCCVCKSTKDLYSVTPADGEVYIVKTFCIKCIDADMQYSDDVKIGEFIIADTSDYEEWLEDCRQQNADWYEQFEDGPIVHFHDPDRIDTERLEWEKNNVCSRCMALLDQHAIAVDEKAICKSCQTTEDFFF